MVTTDELIDAIESECKRGNRDNISRTVFYERFYKRHSEIKWAHLASIVSRNAGYNMCDLASSWLQRAISPAHRQQLFLTYERANWLIFSDAYPQLLLYEVSKMKGEPLFHLLPALNVSLFMQQEWQRFWDTHDEERLWTALIINEQHLIQLPVIESPLYKRQVFESIPYHLQDWLHFSSVLFPTLQGELYGFSVHGFRKVKNRIHLGRNLAALLVQSSHASSFSAFSDVVPHTGCRSDYEQFSQLPTERKRTLLRKEFPLVAHKRPSLCDWYSKGQSLEHYFRPLSMPKVQNLTRWYRNKECQLQIGILLQEWWL
ncbi:hypothetical protein A374_03634 [Fictibacillus macauensis ZFHKF-1]|uniref:DUF2515 domain-containing protein n=1 Tax=Fictibacillus macauensis ZFHKF-1 TaxID=1196324 RepID=I8J4D3_9BACL|nr:DUF2515 family protein [Fictibacillus macauensis]EIT86631.1 hypothetical protein A374_03634 [Fictibacillus macauensis ZFHKF-1]